MVMPATERGSHDGHKGYSTDVVVPPPQADAIRRRMYRDDYAAVGTVLPRFAERLSDEHREHFRAHGYLAMEGLLTPAEVDEAKAALSDLIAHRSGWDKKVWAQEEPCYASGAAGSASVDPELRIRKLAYFVQMEPRLGAVAAHPRLLPVLDQLLGPGHRMIQDMALLKPPFKGSEKPWHQDTAYFDWTPLGGVLGTWIALDEATVENGCMQVIPGTHLEGPAAHFHVRDCQIADDRVQVGQAVVIPLQPGGILFFSGLLQHGTPPNTSARRRRALQFHYAAAGCTHMTIHQHGELFSEGGAYAGCRDWDLEAGMSRAVLSP